MVTDKNKRINGSTGTDISTSNSGILYNHLNLPWKINVKDSAGNDKGTITYLYDATGNKLQKKTAEGNKITTTDYVNSFVYQNDTLQFFASEEGRIRTKNINKADTVYYDYYEKDHLGNIRILLTDEVKTDAYPVASLETTPLPTERNYYSGVDTGRINKSEAAGYPTDTYTSPNDFIQKLRGDGHKVGSGIVLKVMAGDKFNLRANSWYKLNGATPGTPANPLTELLWALSGGVSSVAPAKGTQSVISSSGVLSPGTTSFLNNQSSNYTSSKPKAFVNWLLFDEQFKLDSANSGFEQVGGDTAFTTHIRNDMPVGKCGYLYVYVSNETPNINVYFDNLQVTHARGALIESNQFYSYGLLMRNISYTAAGGIENKLKYNGKELQSEEFADGSGLELYDYGARMQDPQLGRWHSQDKFAEVYVALTPYQYAANNPIKIIDEAGHLLKDKDGNIIATSTGNSYSRSSSVTVDGNKYQTNTTYKEVVVYTDQGTPVRALQQVASYVEQVNADGSTTRVNNAPVDCSQNCHGTTFADSKLVIVDQSNNNESVNVILKEDGYVKVETPEAADIFVQQGGNDIVHSGKVNKDGSVTSDHDQEKPQITTIQKEKDRHDPDVNTTGYKRNGTDKQVSTKTGNASGGVREVSKQQATDIRKKNGLKTTNKAKGEIPSTYELQ